MSYSSVESVHARELKSGAMEAWVPEARIDGSREATEYTGRSRCVHQKLRITVLDRD